MVPSYNSISFHFCASLHHDASLSGLRVFSFYLTSSLVQITIWSLQSQHSCGELIARLPHQPRHSPCALCRNPPAGGGQFDPTETICTTTIYATNPAAGGIALRDTTIHAAPPPAAARTSLLLCPKQCTVITQASKARRNERTHRHLYTAMRRRCRGWPCRQRRCRFWREWTSTRTRVL